MRWLRSSRAQCSTLDESACLQYAPLLALCLSVCLLLSLDLSIMYLSVWLSISRSVKFCVLFFSLWHLVCVCVCLWRLLLGWDKGAGEGSGASDPSRTGISDSSRPPIRSPLSYDSYQAERVKANVCFLWDTCPTASFKTVSHPVSRGSVIHSEENALWPLTPAILFHSKSRKHFYAPAPAFVTPLFRWRSVQIK